MCSDLTWLMVDDQERGNKQDSAATPVTPALQLRNVILAAMARSSTPAAQG